MKVRRDGGDKGTGSYRRAEGREEVDTGQGGAETCRPQKGAKIPFDIMKKEER